MMSISRLRVGWFALVAVLAAPVGRAWAAAPLQEAATADVATNVVLITIASVCGLLFLIFFVVLLTLGLLGVNAWFTPSSE